MLTETEEERIAIIAESENLTQEAAECSWRASQHVAPDHIAKKVERIRQGELLKKMERNKRIDGKTKGAGDKDD